MSHERGVPLGLVQLCTDTQDPQLAARKKCLFNCMDECVHDERDKGDDS